MKGKHQWLFLEPYTHLLRRNGSVLLYNSVSREVLEYTNSDAIDELAGKLEDPSNGYVIPISADQLTKEEIANFVSQLRQTFMGDLLDSTLSKGKPVNVLPEAIVKHSLEKRIPSSPTLVSTVEPHHYIRELTFFVNSSTKESLEPYSKAFRQFSYPACYTASDEIMDINLVNSLIKEVDSYGPSMIHISGANILQYPDFDQLIKVMASTPYPKKYHLFLPNWETPKVQQLLAKRKTTLALYISFPINPEIIIHNLRSLNELKHLKKIEFNLIVRDEKDLQMALEIIQMLELQNSYFKPYFTGENLDFFRENIFVTKEEILAAQPDQQQVLSRLSVNENDFGKFSVMPQGEIFANLNDPKVGNANEHSLAQLVEMEISDGQSWKRTRARVKPCQNCLYHFLCPPISSYELYMKRFNFCDVVPNPLQP